MQYVALSLTNRAILDIIRATIDLVGCLSAQRQDQPPRGVSHV